MPEDLLLCYKALTTRKVQQRMEFTRGLLVGTKAAGKMKSCEHVLRLMSEGYRYTC